jgi:Endonuclease-reverse transcriptase
VPIPTLDKYSLLGLSLTGPDFNLQLINFYHHVTRHRGNLSFLLNASLNHSIPILLGGNFNMHFSLWAPPGKRISPWSEDLESWLDSQGFLSTVPDESVSRMSPNSHPSLIDFIFINEAFLEVPSFPSTCSVSFELSLGSDHAALCVSLPLSSLHPLPTQHQSWIVDTALKDKWCDLFWSYLIPDISDADSLCEAGCILLAQIGEVSDKIFTHPWPLKSRDLPWWSWECSLACAALRSCHWRDRKH